MNKKALLILAAVLVLGAAIAAVVWGPRLYARLFPPPVTHLPVESWRVSDTKTGAEVETGWALIYVLPQGRQPRSFRWAAEPEVSLPSPSQSRN